MDGWMGARRSEDGKKRRAMSEGVLKLHASGCDTLAKTYSVGREGWHHNHTHIWDPYSDESFSWQ